MPKVDGFEVCRRIRHESHTPVRTPVIMLTARGGEDDVVRGLQIGADDYLTKPFSATQLLARMQVVLRRTRGAGEPEHQVANRVRVGGIELDRLSHAVTKDGSSVRLTLLEFRLLSLLAVNAGRV